MLLACQEFCGGGAADGSLPDVVLIHGTGGDANLWNPQVNLLVQKGYRCIVPELRGHGRSADPGQPTDINVHLGDVLETLEAHHVRFPAVFIGHSLGAIISVELAQRRPELFVKILAVSLPGRVPKVMSEMMRIYLSGFHQALQGTFIHRTLPERLRAIVSTDLHALQEIVENFGDVDYISHPLKVTCPVHFLVGRQDMVAPAVYVEQMHRALTNSTLRILEWSLHTPMDEHPGEFNRWVVERVTQD